MSEETPIIRVRNLHVGFGAKTVLKGLDLDIREGEVTGFVGGSGQGKSVLTRAILGLTRKQAGSIEVFGENIDRLSASEHRRLERRWGVLFQGGALFSSLTVRQNIQAPMREYLSLSQADHGRTGSSQAEAGRPAAGLPRKNFPPNFPAA